MDTIKYKGKEYPTRTFLVNSPEFGEPQEIKISVMSLVMAMEGKYGINGSVEQDIDEEIYIYVEDEEIKLTPEEICKSCLDIPMEFLEDIS